MPRPKLQLDESSVAGQQETGITVADLCRKHGISSTTFYKWKAKHGALDVSEALG
jgi:putative transposase